ncbi:Uncharacterized protein BM_BM9720 [Brugia malayi]|uniref:Bm9720 n=2 Tax=Brugia TaxID=6278 RepID=A0A0K0K089_BRUMA|nr:Uncharacterized protein BM_BM9720 [Brugia malayi]CDP95240.1 Bm9720 [Brugia malayi]VDN90501.1 unnamed protein product [Brugia pahangi]VIO92122.1 Uncharacterized protein BM_BM9720 [Brugia malayi]
MKIACGIREKLATVTGNSITGRKNHKNRKQPRIRRAIVRDEEEERTLADTQDGKLVDTQ